MGHILAQGRGRLANSPSLSDRRWQCTDGRSEILLVEPRARRMESGHGQVRDVALVASRRIRSLVDRELLSRGKRRTGPGPLRSSRLALRASTFFRNATEPFVLCPRATTIQRCVGRRFGSDHGGTGPQRNGCLAGSLQFAASFTSPTLRTGTRQAMLPPTPKPAGPNLAHKNPNRQTASVGNRRWSDKIVPPRTRRLTTYNLSSKQLTANHSLEVALSN